MYNDEKNKKIIAKYREYISEMPSFVKDFFTFFEVTKNAAPNTILAYAYDLEVFFYYLISSNPNINSYADITLELIDNLTMKDIQEYLSFLVSYTKDGITYTNSETGRARKLTSLRSFYKYYQTVEKSITNNPASAMPMPKIREKDIIAMDTEEIAEVISTVDKSNLPTKRQQKWAEKTKYRDMALIITMLGTGIRVSECVGISLSDIDWKNMSIHITRKGQKEQIVYFNNDVADALQDYVSNERKPLNSKDDALFLSLKGTRITPRSVERLVKKYAESVGMNKKITPHKLRSSYGTQLYEATQDPMLVKDALGHANLGTVQKYVRLSEERRKKAGQVAGTWLNKDGDSNKTNDSHSDPAS